jgi:hypothetical protein
MQSTVRRQKRRGGRSSGTAKTDGSHRLFQRRGRGGGGGGEDEMSYGGEPASHLISGTDRWTRHLSPFVGGGGQDWAGRTGRHADREGKRQQKGEGQDRVWAQKRHERTQKRQAEAAPAAVRSLGGPWFWDWCFWAGMTSSPVVVGFGQSVCGVTIAIDDVWQHGIADCGLRLQCESQPDKRLPENGSWSFLAPRTAPAASSCVACLLGSIIQSNLPRQVCHSAYGHVRFSPCFYIFFSFLFFSTSKTSLPCPAHPTDRNKSPPPPPKSPSCRISWRDVPG